MPIEAQYVTYYGIHLYHYSYPWGGNTYNKLLVTEFPNENLENKSVTSSNDVTFIYPRLVGNPVHVDGVAEGHITLYNNTADVGGGGSNVTINSYTVSLKKTADVPGAEEILGSYTHSLVTSNSLGGYQYLTLPVYIVIEKKKLEANEKILLNITFNSDGGGVPNISHALDPDNIDIQIKIPYQG